LATERKAPDAILSTDLTGSVGSIQDDPDSPDANWLTTTNNNADHHARVSFPTPTGSPTVGAGLQEFRARVRKYGGTGTPQARIELWENGVFVRAGSDTGVTGSQVIAFTWKCMAELKRFGFYLDEREPNFQGRLRKAALLSNTALAGLPQAEVVEK